MSVTTTIDSSLALLMVDASIESYYAFDSHDPARGNPQGVDNLAIPTDAETLVSLKPDASTLCWFWPAPGTPSLPV